MLLLALKVQEGAMSQGTQVASKAGKGKDVDSPPESQKGTQPYRHILDYRPSEL